MQWLPIGSIVMLDKAQAPCMIVGRMVVDSATGKSWDYAGCQYPVGVLPENGFALFAKTAIVHVLHVGYLSEAETECISAMEEAKKSGNL